MSLISHYPALPTFPSEDLYNEDQHAQSAADDPKAQDPADVQYFQRADVSGLRGGCHVPDRLLLVVENSALKYYSSDDIRVILY